MSGGATRAVLAAGAFFGRAEDLAAIDTLLARDARVVTLVGTGGIGKTRVALQFVATRGDQFPDALFCDLTEAHDHQTVVALLAAAAGAKGASSADALGDALALREAVLFVVDNCEQAIGAVARVLDALLERARSARFLVTSREPLGLGGAEEVIELAPLGTPGERTDIAASDAVRLFIDRADRACGARAKPHDLAVVAEIVRRLDGIPLAIELAAARVAVLDERAVLRRLDDSLSLLRGGVRTAAARSQTVRGAIEWSWALLEQDERVALAQLSVFHGGFLLDAAEEVVDLSTVPAARPVLDVVQSLRNKSVLRVLDAAGMDEVRFGLFQTIRAFAAEKLGELDDPTAPAERHARHYLAMGIESEARAWHGGATNLSQLAVERDNLLAIHSRARAIGSPDALRATIALHPIIAARGPLALYSAILDGHHDEVLLGSADAELAVRFLLVRGRARQLLSDAEGSRRDYQRALLGARAAGVRPLTARALVHVGIADKTDGDLDGARERLEGALAMFVDLDDARAAAVCRSALGAVELLVGRVAVARHHLDTAIAALRTGGDVALLAMVLVDRGIVLQEQGELEAAARTFDEAIALNRSLDARRALCVALGYAAGLAHEQGDLAAARERYEAAVALADDLGDRKWRTVFGAGLGAVLARSGDLTASELHLARAESDARAHGEPRVLASVLIHHGHLEAARGAATKGRERLAHSAGLLDRSDDVRFAHRMLERTLGDVARLVEPTRGPMITVAGDGSWFRTTSMAEPCDLSSRRVMSRLLLALVRHRLEHPDEPLLLPELVARGWPGERLPLATAVNRLHVTLSKLRKSGLDAVILRRQHGYLLDPSFALEIARGELSAS